VAALIENIWQIILMAILLLVSGFMSGSETAFFNISNSQLISLKKSTNKFEQLSARLLARPKQLLTSLLFGNMAVNVLFFSLASVLSIDFGKTAGPAAGTVSAIVCFFALLIFGEMLPKSIAYSESKRFCRTAAPFCYVCTRILSPLVKVLDFCIVTPAVRLFGPAIRPKKNGELVTANQFKLLIDSSMQTGHIDLSQNQILSEVVELSYLKVRHIIKPRVDMITCQVTEPHQRIEQIMLENKITSVVVCDGDIDNIAGILSHRDILLNPDEPIKKLVNKPTFIPEQKSLESLLDFFRKSGNDFSIVVDEYGGIAGVVSLEDIVEELIGPIEPAATDEAIEQIGPLQYRLKGNMAIHDWAEAFGVEPGQSPYSTIGGLTTALLGKIPKQGDAANIKNIKLTVEKVARHRIETILLTFEPINEASE
jgi:CBS domain containing-hemolysin-like protein